MSLNAHGLVAGYDSRPLLGPYHLHAPRGDFVCLIGANGAGKSTLIRTLCGMQPVLAGDLLLDGHPLTAQSSRDRARQLAVVLTDRVDTMLMTGYELACLGRYPHIGWGGRLRKPDHAIVQAALLQAGAAALAGKLVSRMSDGERQKIMIARALAQQPKVLVLDEATAFLDLPRRIELMQLLQDLAHQQQLSIVLSTHDLELALRYADALWLIDGQRQLHTGAPEDLALSGALSSAFSAEGLAFDLERGELRVGRGGQRPMRVNGSGMRQVWTLRAVQRLGYCIRDDAAHTVDVLDDGYSLSLAQGGATRHATVAALAAALRVAHATRGTA
ncbi:ABC transporter ATP-binding protein [Achromobacter insolitus]|uniref:ABC transporter ATP-binding protein n=1 Tax=Achromobacter insolitus TaxID=217204 RepID=UPI0017482D28|nr:ABC transporter ATP-binding protein [Achromobacter insolitus]